MCWSLIRPREYHKAGAEREHALRSTDTGIREIHINWSGIVMKPGSD